MQGLLLLRNDVLLIVVETCLVGSLRTTCGVLHAKSTDVRWQHVHPCVWYVEIVERARVKLMDVLVGECC